MMMDIPAGNALPDPWTGARAAGLSLARPHHLRSGARTARIAGRDRRRGDAGRRLLRQRRADRWNYRRMVLHYADLAVAAGGVDAFLIGSELRALTRVRSASGVYPAVEALATSPPTSRRSSARQRSSPTPPTGPNTAPHVVDAGRTRCAFRSIRCGRRRRSTPSASTITRRSPTGATAATISTARSPPSIYDRGLSRRQSARRRGLRLVLRRRRRARRADAHADHRRPRQALGVPRQGSVELVVATRTTSASAASSCRADGVGAADQADLAHRARLPGRRQGRQPAHVFPDPKSAEAGLPHFSSGGATI